MAKIVMFGNQKGGVGKSTLTALAANALAGPPFNYSVFVVDADQQQSLSRRRLVDVQGFDGVPPYQLAFMTLAEFQRDIEAMDGKHDFIFIDAPGKLDANLKPAQQEVTKYLVYTDLLFVPFVPGNYSTEATTDYLKIALRIKAKRKESPRPLEILGMVNMSEQRTLDDRFLMEEIEEVKRRYAYQLLRPGRGQR